MQIKISVDLTEEQIDILARQKGWKETAFVRDNAKPWKYIESENPQSKEDYLSKVFEKIILGETSKEYINHSNKQKETIRINEENTIRGQFLQSISSTIV